MTPLHKDEDIPDRVSSDPNSPHYHLDCRMIDVFFNGDKRKGDVTGFCRSEGWIKKILFLSNGKIKRERGKISTVRMSGVVSTRLKP